MVISKFQIRIYKNNEKTFTQYAVNCKKLLSKLSKPVVRDLNREIKERFLNCQNLAHDDKPHRKIVSYRLDLLEIWKQKYFLMFAQKLRDKAWDI